MKEKNMYNIKSGENPDLIKNIHNTIKKEIVHKKIQSGKKINQKELAKTFGVSRTPIIKALQRLESEGLVDHVYQSGYFVHQLSVKELLELFIIRESLESIAIADVAETINNKQIKELKNLFTQFKGKKTIDTELYWENDQIFHDKIMEFCNNDLAKKINNSFQILNRTYYAGLVREPSKTLLEHENLISALKNHEVEKARKVITKHLNKSKKLLMKQSNKLEDVGIDPANYPAEEKIIRVIDS